MQPSQIHGMKVYSRDDTCEVRVSVTVYVYTWKRGFVLISALIVLYWSAAQGIPIIYIR